MIFWIRLKEDSEDGKKRYVRIEEDWQNYFFIASNNKSKLDQLVQNHEVSSLISSYDFVKKSETITDTKQSSVLKLLTLGKKSKLANIIETMDGYNDFRLYDVDLIPEQQYFFDHDIFPLGLFEITENKSGLVWKSYNNDKIGSTDYFLPYFEKIYIKINFPKGKIVKLTEDEINSISIVQFQNNDKNHIIEIYITNLQVKIQIFELVYKNGPGRWYITEY